MKFIVGHDSSGRRGKAIGALSLVALTATLTLLQWSSQSLGQNPGPQGQPWRHEKLGGGGFPSRRRAALEETTCTPPAIDEEKLVPYGCKLLRDSCLDQVKLCPASGISCTTGILPVLKCQGVPHPTCTAGPHPAAYRREDAGPPQLDALASLPVCRCIP